VYVFITDCRDLLDEAKDYHLVPDRRGRFHTFKTRPRCCSDVAGVVYAIGGLTSLGKDFCLSFSLEIKHVLVSSLCLMLRFRNGISSLFMSAVMLLPVYLFISLLVRFITAYCQR